MSFYSEMARIQRELNEIQIASLIPESDDPWPSDLSSSLKNTLKRRASFNHIKKIRHPRTLGILVLNFDKYGVKNYIGPNAFAEIAIAVVAGKKVYLANGTPDTYKDELRAWEVIELQGDLDCLKQEYILRCQMEKCQMELF